MIVEVGIVVFFLVVIYLVDLLGRKIRRDD